MRLFTTSDRKYEFKKWQWIFCLFLISGTISKAQDKVGLIADQFIIGDTELPPIFDPSLLFYDNLKHSFRYGSQSLINWSTDSIGNYSFEAGDDNKSAGDYSFSFGHGNNSKSQFSIVFGIDNTLKSSRSTVFGDYNTLDESAISSTAIGFSNTVSGQGSLAHGWYNNIESNYSAAIGSNNLVQGLNGFALGSYNTINDQFSVAIGNSNTVEKSISFTHGVDNTLSESHSYAFGQSNNISQPVSVAIGVSNNIASAQSFTLGNNLRTTSAGSFNIGKYNVCEGTNSITNKNAPAFTIGIGSNDTNRKNAVTVLKNGKTVYGLGLPEDRFEIKSDAGENPFKVQVDEVTKFHMYENGSISMGADNGNLPANVIYIDEALSIGTDVPEAKIDVRGTALVKMDSDNLNSHLTLHESSTVDFARIDFTSDATSNTKWTVKGRPASVIAKSDFRISLEGIGDVIHLKGSNFMGIGRSPSYPLHIGTSTSDGNGAHVTTGGTWTNGSSRTFKENFQPVNGNEVLEALMGIKIQRWEYKGSSEGIHLGPIAEDFHEAFGLGNDEKYISTIDTDGVALAAIQALYLENKELGKQNSKLENELDQLRSEIDNIKKLLGKIK